MKKWIIFLFGFFNCIFADTPIGIVVAVEGTVKAINHKQERLLAPQNEIFVSDQIKVGEEGCIQIQFTDGGLLNLNPNSEFEVQSYSYKKMLKPDQYTASLNAGGFKYLSGSIAKKNPDEYEVKTPSATIGLRGTLVIVNIIDREQVYFGVEEGRAIITNQSGSVLIGEGEKVNFSFVAGKNHSPQKMLARPPELNMSHFVVPQGAYSMQRTRTPASSSPKKAEKLNQGTHKKMNAVEEPKKDEGQLKQASPKKNSPVEEPKKDEGQLFQETPNTRSKNQLPKTGKGGVQIHGGC